MGGRKITTMFAGETNEGTVARGCLQEGHSTALAVQPGWMNSQEDSMGVAVIHWCMQMTLLPSQVENSQTPSQSMYRV
jgi:hypothetical protein